VSTDFVTTVNQLNRFGVYGRGVDLYNSASSLSGTNYFAADYCFGFAAFTTSTEATWVASFSRSSDVGTIDGENNGNAESVVLALSAQNLSGQSIGSYSVTGGNVKCFSGKKAAADWFGGSALSSVSYSGSTLATLQSDGNIGVYRVDLG